MINFEVIAILFGLFAMAFMYAMVGHGGGSGYLAVLSLASFSPEELRPTALLLNIIVASLATYKFQSKQTMNKSVLAPLICVSIPCAFVGGMVSLDPSVYKPILGVILFIAAIKLLVPINAPTKTVRPSLFLLCAVGGLIGFTSGLIGIGGGILLSPLLLLCGWATAKETAALSAPFILFNSVAGIAGIMAAESTIPVQFVTIIPLCVAVLLGGFLGAHVGSQLLGNRGLRTVLGIVLVIASVKMCIGLLPVIA